MCATAIQQNKGCFELLGLRVKAAANDCYAHPHVTYSHTAKKAAMFIHLLLLEFSYQAPENNPSFAA